MAPHRDDLEAAQHRIRALEDRVEELETSATKDAAPAVERNETPAKPPGAKKKVAATEAEAHAQVAMVQAQMDATVARAQKKIREGLFVVCAVTLLVLAAWSANYVVAVMVDPGRESSGKRPLFADEGVLFAAALAAIVASFALPRVIVPRRLMHRADDPRADEPWIPRLGWAAITLGAVVANVLVVAWGNR